MKSLRMRAVVYSLITLLGLLCALPNFLPDSIAYKLPNWYANNTVTLGLDLRGGSHLLLEVEPRDLLIDNNEQVADQIRSALEEEKLYPDSLRANENTIEIVPKRTTQLDQIERIARSTLKSMENSTSYSIDSSDHRIILSPSKDYLNSLTADAVERSLEVIRRRLNESGLIEPSITRQGTLGVLVQLPGVEDPQKIRQLLGTTAKLTFHWVARNEVSSYSSKINIPGENGQVYQLERRVALQGKHISDARLTYNPDTGEPVVNFNLDKEGARRFGEMTATHIGRPLAIVLDQRVISAPVIRSVIAGGSGEISGAFTSNEASALALLLRAGALPAPLKVMEERTVGPDLGSDSIAMGLATGLIGAILVFGFMVTVYGRWGLIACLGLLTNVGLIFGVLSFLGATLTLPGIAGIILTIGMAVDSNILINERIREECRKGRSARFSLEEGFKLAYSTILDSNLTTLIAVGLLFLFGTGPVRGFAATIGIGLLTSLFTAIAVTRVLMEWRIRKLDGRPFQISGLKLIDALGNWPINFMRARKFGLAISAILSLTAIVLFVQPGLKYGIDFNGGTIVEIDAPTASLDGLRKVLTQHNLGEAAIQEIDGSGRYFVRFPVNDMLPLTEQTDVNDAVIGLKQAVMQYSADAKFPRVEMVGPKVSGTFSDITILTLLLAGAGMLTYLWARFEFHFALAAILTVILDLTKTIGFFVLAGIEFNLTAVAALLALIGYSINDKVVVFDRVRENLRLTPDKPFIQILNESITSTLTRTVFTSVTTFLALLPMAVAGGAAVTSFALPMLFGIIIGTSSSIFIASPIVYILGQRRARKGLPQLRPTAEEIRRQLPTMP
ncbi:protein translocase subunit SecD [Ketobacter sp. MCCC 1A13808]|uniref:protein translocase subunit SecD n=1 Tax=Ketobacter sp. MCCC 1A13808 TaxID=2602738 RepID=UPI0012EC2D09|nr:protein translocase subunit SecD [Ketobacter sp. MCCC 1A13808]MVF13677.1 protein translocase subunit SecD [Ketobacter sp. MCCC 1A13808]